MRSVQVLVQHHPARAHLVGPLLERLPGATVITDPGADTGLNPWRCYRACLQAIEATHGLIVQDDTRPLPGLAAALPGIAAACPESIILLFHGGAPRENVPDLRHARRSHCLLTPLPRGRFLPVVATLWPRALAVECLDYNLAMEQRRSGWDAGFTSDDERCGRFCRDHAIVPVATLPSLVQHDDVEGSLIGKRTAAGADPTRVAWWWDDSFDPVTAPW